MLRAVDTCCSLSLNNVHNSAIDNNNNNNKITG